MTELKDINKPILDFFKQYESKKDFVSFYKKLENLSEFKYTGDIDLGEIIMPNIEPSDKLKDFHKSLNDEWTINEKTQINFYIKLFLGDPIENHEEATLMLAILSETSDNPIFKKITENLEKTDTINTDDIIELMSIGDVFCNSLAGFFSNSFE